MGTTPKARNKIGPVDSEPRQGAGARWAPDEGMEGGMAGSGGRDYTDYGDLNGGSEAAAVVEKGEYYTS